MDIQLVLGGSPPSDLLQVHNVAKRLGRSPRTIRRLINRGELPAIRYGLRRWLISIRHVEALRLSARDEC
jgi:excisionase family DNA binding protein